MIEAVLPEDQPKPASRVVEPPISSLRPARPVHRSGLSVLALTVALIAAGAAGWGLWQDHQLRSKVVMQGQVDQLREQLATREQVGQLREQLAALEQNDQALHAKLANYAPLAELNAQQHLLVQLQGDQQLLNQQLTSVLGASRQNWRLAEAEHLLRLASLRLVALQDVSGAQTLIQGANEILRQQNDSHAYAAREQVAKLLQALRSVEQPDRTGLFLQLSALRDQVSGLQPLAPEFTVDADSAAASDGESRMARWREQLSKYFRIQLNADQDVRPLLDGEQLLQLQLALSLALEQAQWAALNADGRVYQKSLEQARQILSQSFQQNNPQSKAMLSAIGQLSAQSVSVVVPDMQPALTALGAYIEWRQQAQEQPAPAEGGRP